MNIIPTGGNIITNSDIRININHSDLRFTDSYFLVTFKF